MREGEEIANAGNGNKGCGVDEAGGSVAKDEVKLLRAADSDDQFNTTEQEVKSQSQADNEPAANLMALIQSFEMS